jgi:hypothetical protein
MSIRTAIWFMKNWRCRIRRRHWFRTLIDGRSVAGASEALWNAVEAHETRVNAQLAREIVLALPVELSREDNIVLMQELSCARLSRLGAWLRIGSITISTTIRMSMSC